MIKHYVYSLGPTSCIYTEYAAPFSTFSENAIFHVKGSSEGYEAKRISLIDISIFFPNKNGDIFHFHSVHFCFLVFCAFLLRKKTVFTVHTSWDNYNFFHKVMAIICLFMSERNVFVSSASLLSFPNFLRHLLGKKNSVINNSFDVEVFPTPKQKKDQWVVCGRMVKIKRTSSAINFFLNNKSQGDVLKIMGDGPERLEIERRYGKYIDAGVIQILGVVSRETVYNVMLESKYYVSASSVEGLPVTAMEAVSSGCFCFLSNIPAHLVFEDCPAIAFWEPNSDFGEIALKGRIPDFDEDYYSECRDYIRKKFNLGKFVCLYKRIYEGI